MTAALKVSPAPRVSTRLSGGKASEWTITPSGPKASAPFSAQAHIRTALRQVHNRDTLDVWEVSFFRSSVERLKSPLFDSRVESSQSSFSCQEPEVAGDVFTDKHLNTTQCWHHKFTLTHSFVCQLKDAHHVSVWKQLVERLSGFLDLHRNGYSLW